MAHGRLWHGALLLHTAPGNCVCEYSWFPNQVGAVAVDTLGVRRTSIMSLLVATARRLVVIPFRTHWLATGPDKTPRQVSRALITFGRARAVLVFSLLVLSPFGEAVLATGALLLGPI